MQNTWLSLLPPLVVIALVCILRRLNISLVLGIGLAAFIAASGSLSKTYSILSMRLCQQIRDVDNLFLFAFLIAIGTLAALITQTGGVRAFASNMAKKINSAQTAQSSSCFLSFLLFIDDYLSILTVGHVMRPLMDAFAVPRAKLAFLIHSLAGSVVILTPVSSWVTAITAYLEQAGVSTDLTTSKILRDPLFVYLQTIPYIFYSFIIVASVWFIIHARISFGPMKKQDDLAQNKTSPSLHYEDEKGSTSDVILPLVVLLTLVFVGIPYMGNFYWFGGTNSLLEAFKTNQYTFQVLCFAGTISLLVGFIWAIVRNVLPISQVWPIMKEGFWLMYSPIVMVFLASVLGLLLRNDLLTGQYLASLLQGTVSVAFLPLLFFFVSLITALITGTAWGTMALLLYIAVPMLTTMFAQTTTPIDPSTLPILFPVLGSIFSGAVCGNHISPISETTLMSATSAGVDPLTHTSTQLPYTLPAVIGTIVSFSLIGVLAPWGVLWSILVSLSAGIITSFVLLWGLNRIV